MPRWLSRLPRPAPLEWVALVAGAFLVLKYAWLMDDAFVYFRYADNFLWLHAGLVFNRGEFVEGFTSPAWMMLLLALRATALSYWWIIRVVAVLSWVGCWGLLVGVNRRLSPQGSPTVNLPPLHLGFHYGALCSHSSGLESPLLPVMSALMGALLLNPASRALQIAIGVVPLIRHELLISQLVVGVWTAWKLRRVPIALVLSALGFTGAWLLFRIIYYADLLPNTFYLKDATRVGQGLRYVWNATWPYGLPAALPLAAIAVIALRRRHVALPQLGARVAMLATATASLSYVVRIGGDFIHYRYRAFAYLLLLLPLGGLAETALAAWRPRGRKLAALALGVAVASVTFLARPPQQLMHPYHFRGRHSQVVNGIEDAMHHRQRPELQRNAWAVRDTSDIRTKMLDWYRHTNPPSFLSLSLDFWCVRTYGRVNWYVIQSLGLCDPMLSRIDLPFDRPGHKWSLHPLAGQLLDLRAAVGLRRGACDAAIRAGIAPDWVVANAASLRLIERKMYNRHRFGENLGLALTQVGRIHLVSPPPPVATRQVPRDSSPPE